MTSAGTTGCTIPTNTSDVVDYTTAGTCQVTATAAATNTYSSATKAVSFVISLASQTASFYTSGSYSTTTTSESTTYSSGGTYQTYAKGSGSGTITFASTTTGVCTVGSSSGLVTFVTAGTCDLTATAGATNTYSASPAASLTLTIGQATQTVTWSPTTAITASTSDTFTPSAAASTSGNGAITYAVTSAGTTGCTIPTNTSDVVDYTTAGTCQVTATAAATTDYSSGSTAVSFVISLASQTVTWSPTTAITASTSDTFTPSSAASTSGNGAITYAVTSAGTTGCTIPTNTSDVVDYTTAGTCQVTATAAATNTYSSATKAVSFVISLASQTASFYTSGSYSTTTTSESTTYSSGGTYQTYAKGSGSGTITFASTTTGVCTVGSSSGLVTFVTAGTCDLTATAGATNTYSASPAASLTLTIGQATQTVTWSPTTAITASTSDTFTPSAAASTSGNGAITYAVTSAGTTGCTIPTNTSDVVDYTTAGTCQVTATAAATTDYSSGSTAVSFVISLASQTASFYTTSGYTTPTTSESTTYSSGGTYQTYAKGSGSGTITFASTTTGVCTINSSSGLVTFVTAGTCDLTATAGATNTYSASPAASLTLTIGQASQTASFYTTSGYTTPTTSESTTYSSGGTYQTYAKGSGGGTITFASSTTSVCTVGSTSGLVTFVTAGTCDLTAAAGDTMDYSASPAADLTLTVGESPTASTITSITATPVVGQAITFDVNVASVSPGSGTPTGTVTVSDGTLSCTTAALDSSGDGTCQITETVAGSYNFTATYNSDGNFATSSSAPSPVTVGESPTASTITSITATPVVGQAITFDVNVASVSPGSGTPTGTVTVSDGTLSCTTAALDSSGDGTCQITETVAGSYNFTATYNSDGNFATSSSAPSPVTVGESPTASTITSITATPVVGQAITFDVNVASVSPGSGTPTGTVTVSDGTLSCTTAALDSSGDGTCQITETVAGSYNFTATYNSDGNFATSSSAPSPVTVGESPTASTITSITATPVVGQAITFDVNVASVSPGSGTPTGTVTVSDGTLSCTTAALDSSGDGTCQITETVAGSYNFTATYNSDGNFATSSSAPSPVTVGESPTASTITSITATPVVGQAITFDVNVASVSPGSGTPTGTVTVSDGTLSCTTAALDSSGDGTCQITETVAGSYNFTATYNSDGNFATSSSAPSPVTVGESPTASTITSITATPVVGQAITFDVNVASVSPGSGTPTGTVTVSDGTLSCTTAALDSSGDGTCQITETVAGSYNFTATYNSDGNFATSSSAPSPVTVAKGLHPHRHLRRRHRLLGLFGHLRL